MVLRGLIKTSCIFGIPSVTGYYIGNYATGSMGYSPPRSSSWVKKQIDKVVVRDRAQETTFETGYHEVLSPLGMKSIRFKDPKSPASTKIFIYCGPSSVGFPFLVHGGLLAALLRSSAEFALGHLQGNLTIKYRHPTFVDQVLKIESHKNEIGNLELFIFSEDNKCLVEAIMEQNV